MRSGSLLQQIQVQYQRPLSLGLRPAYRELLAALGHPEQHLPPVIHVAGTNGKGSSCAMLQACLQAAGLRAHRYTSPHLVSFHERINLAGENISEAQLCTLLDEILTKFQPGAVSFFEATTALAFLAFARTPADAAIIEVGMGGRLDATNVLPPPRATLITRLSYDHREFLGDTISAIAAEKAGIMQADVPCVVAAQTEAAALATLTTHAAKLGSPLFIAGRDWRHQLNPDGTWSWQGGATFGHTALTLPAPALTGPHQYENASAVIATLQLAWPELPHAALATGLQQVRWPARLQRLQQGPMVAALPAGSELWLDGGHNDSAGAALAAQAAAWQQADGRPLYLVLGMLRSKDATAFLAPLAPYLAGLVAVPVAANQETAQPCHPPATLAAAATTLGIPATSATKLATALPNLSLPPQARVLVAGSLYLAGEVLANHH